MRKDEPEEIEAAEIVEGEMTEELAYQILGLQKGGPVEEIKKRQQKLIKAYHPDSNGVTESTMMKKINSAYDFLKEKRNF